MNKSRSQRIHAKRRASEREGLALNRHDLKAIALAIKAGKMTFIERQSGRVTVWEGTYQEQPIRVVYDNQRHQVVTFLPRRYAADGTPLIRRETSGAL